MRWRRVALGTLVVMAGLAFAWPLLVRAVFAPLLEDEWGGAATLGAARWLFSDRLVLHDVTAPQQGADAPMIEVDRIELRFERTPLLHDPGKLVSADFLGGRLRWQGRAVCTVERVEYRYGGEDDKHVHVHGIAGDVTLEHVGDWIDVITRIVEAPGVKGDGQGELLREVTVVDGALALNLAIAGGEPQRIAFAPLACRLRPTADQALAIDALAATVLGGAVNANGSVDWSGEAMQWHLQANLQQLDLAEAGARLAWLPTSSSGHVDAFADLGSVPAGGLGGAGWVHGRQVAVWEQAVAKRVVREAGVEPDRDDAFEQIRCELRVDRGRLYFDNVTALGEPLNLFGNGSIRLDGEDLELGFVPRLRSVDLDRTRPAENDPTVSDVVTGALVEIKVEGSLDGVETFVQPLPVVTQPLRAFLDRIR